MKRIVYICLFLMIGMFAYAQQLKKGLYVGDTFKEEMDLSDALDWITSNAKNEGEYTIVLDGEIASPSNVLDYGGKKVNIHLTTTDTISSTVTYVTRSPSSSLFTIKKNVTFVLEGGVSLKGLETASRPPVTVDGGIFIMESGSVEHSNVEIPNWFGGGVDVLHGGTFIINGGIVYSNCSSAGAGVNVGENCTLIMNGGAICDNIAHEKGNIKRGLGFGGGVFVDKNATFTMNGGRISGNYAGVGNDYGGGNGVYVNGVFTMVDGQIFGNGNFGKGAVCVSGNGIFTMKAGCIRDHWCPAVYIDINVKGALNLHVPSIISGAENGKFIMEGGEIYSNKGWGVCGNGIFEMNNGSIHNNHGGVSIQKGAFTMNAGEISKNSHIGVELRISTFIMNEGLISENVNSEKDADAGGVYIGERSIFTMNNGVISNNSANNGGGVYVSSGGQFFMNDGVISGNKAKVSGGGVYVSMYEVTGSIGDFIKSNTGGIIYGGEVSGDKANKSGKYGHAVYTVNGSKDATAKATKGLDSRKQGAEGGWE